jgi:tight adherence protein B
MLDPDLIRIGALAMAAVAVAGLVYALAYPYLSGEIKSEKRIQSAIATKNTRVARQTQADLAGNRRKAVAETLKELESREKSRQKQTLSLRLERAGLEITPRVFWIASAVTGVMLGFTAYLSMPNMPLPAVAAAVFVGTLGLPRWVLKFLTKRRQKKFLDEFANAIDVIVRGAKSGLPLNECLNIIARESPDPICGEFRELVEQQRVGVPLSDGFERMMARMPLSEVKFFAIVISIQQQAGGNLSEALGNLSGVLRDRKKLQAKVSALSAEAKASAAVLGAMPFIVMTMVYLTTPAYIALLWTTKTGQFLLVIAGFWMTCGILVMKKMINFKY